MITENKKGKEKKRRIRGWILTIVGGLVMLCGICYPFWMSYSVLNQQGIVEPYEGYNREFMISLLVGGGIPYLLMGITLVIPGCIMLRKNEISRQSRGWILVIMGGLYIIISILGIGIDVIFSRTSQDMIVNVLCRSLFLILGILGLVYGIRGITRKKNTTRGDLDVSDNPQGEANNEHGK